MNKYVKLKERIHENRIFTVKLYALVLLLQLTFKKLHDLVSNKSTV